METDTNPMDNFSFTLYEVFGYVFPGGIALLGITVLYWACFVPSWPLGIGHFQPGPVTWVSVIVASYALGHAVQALGNLIFRGAEASALGLDKGTLPLWLRQEAQVVAGEILDVEPTNVEPKWVFRTLDEYALQIAKDGDRDMFVYREGFYRGTALSCFLLALALLVRLFIPGASIQFSKVLFPVSWWQSLLTAVIVGGTGFIFVRRYLRFAEYRITRAVLAALILRKTKLGNSDNALNGKTALS